MGEHQWRRRLLRRSLVMAASLGVVSSTLAALVSSPSSTSSSSPAILLSSTSTSGVPASVEAQLKSYYHGTFTAPPKSGPAAQKGKTVWVVSCGQTTSCAVGTAGAVAAAKALGWTAKICDGNSDINNAYVNCINEALAAKASGIITNAIDCATIKQPLEAAKTESIPVVNVAGLDCSQNLPQSAGPNLFTASVIPSKAYPSQGTLASAAAKAEVAWAIATTDGKAKLLDFSLTDLSVGIYAEDAVVAEMKLCPSCQLYQVPFTLTQFDPTDLTSLFQAGMLKHPQANSVFALVNAVYLSGLAQAIVSSGKHLDAVSAGNEALAFDRVRTKGGISAIVGQDFTWEGWAAADTLNRVFAHQPAVPEGLGFQLVDGTHNLPASGGYVAPVDYEKAYETVWNR